MAVGVWLTRPSAFGSRVFAIASSHPSPSAATSYNGQANIPEGHASSSVGKKGTECSVCPSSPGLTNNPPNPPPTRPPAHRSVVEVHGAKGRRNGRTSRGERDPSRDAYGAGSRLHGSRGSACQRIALGALCYRRLSQHDKPTPHRCSQRSSGAVGDLIAKDDAFFSFQERWLARQRPARRRQCSHCGPGWSHTGPFPG